jgi:hypothetical protein
MHTALDRTYVGGNEVAEKEAPVASKNPTRKPRPQPVKGYFESKSPRSRDESRAAGKALRDKVPRESHADWRDSSHRPDPIELLIASNEGRLPDLVPIRHGRMLTYVVHRRAVRGC